ncbi:MerR family transcriptional regulator [Ornithinimicrobium tianjinense]|uniref:Transcriptional regulator n=1 Tax=Ornithinimicrobium tianjinense TaxID=1195761 RepID=A0A917F8Q6_9MICO|nr:transcriptional regulator [Ornithinimicrobium tianjinense]
MPYTVKQVSSLTGIAADTLRAWERRYGVVSPKRTESRYRLYDDADLERLRSMARLVASGSPASLAAQQVLAELPETRVAETQAAERLPAAPSVPADPSLMNSSATGPRPVPDAAPSASVPAADTLVGPAQNLDRAEVDRILDQAFASGSFESVVEHWLLPALQGLGDAWVDGRVDVAGEHLVSAAVRDRLGRAFDAAGIALGGPVVLAGLPPGSLHELASLAFATCLRRLGADVRWLGSDVPEDSWVHAADRLAPAAVVLSVPMITDTEAAANVVRRLKASHPDLPIYVGGRGAASQTVSGATRLPPSVAGGAREVATRLLGA